MLTEEFRQGTILGLVVVIQQPDQFRSQLARPLDAGGIRGGGSAVSWKFDELDSLRPEFTGQRLHVPLCRVTDHNNLPDGRFFQKGVENRTNQVLAVTVGNRNGTH